jgi:large subunit ribosomal protein L25
MEEIELQVQGRDGRGKGPARRMRRGGQIPAVFYGPKRGATPLTVDAKQFAVKIGRIEGSHLIRFQSAVGDLAQQVALVRDVQTHPVTGDVLHLDFYEVDLTKRLRVTAPLHFVGKARGIADGGILQPIMREIEVECLPTDIPQYLEVDVSPLGIHESIHIADVPLPPNVEAVYETNEAVVTVLAPTVEEVAKTEEVAPEAAAAAGAAPAEGAPGKAAPAKEKES